MNVHRDQSEPIVMDEKILREAVLEKLPDELARCIAKAEGIHFDEILTLTLEYRNIGRIGQLWEFPSLTRLELNCNLIEKIEGLDRLVNLTWLNLSFNRIEKIEGLECLRELEVLNLTSNSISVIENMDTLEKLTHFSIANNLLGQLDSVQYLRKFTNLFSLNLSGNPVCEDDTYKHLTEAHFKKLMFLDNRLVDKERKEQTSTTDQNDMDELRQEMLLMQQATEAKQEAEIKLYKDAFVEFLNGSYLFKSMFEDDSEEDSLNGVPGVAPLLEKFEHQTVELCMQISEIGLAEHKRRETEVSSFFSGQTKAVTDCQQKVSQILDEFDEQHRERMVELQQSSDPDLVKVKLDHHEDEINQLCNSLMALVLKLVSQLEDTTQTFDNSISDMVGNFVETVQKIFAQCQDLEDDYHEKIQEIVEAALTNAAKNDLPNDVKMLFSNENQVRHAVATAHDNHQVKIRDRETQLVTRINAWKTALMEGIEDKVLKLNHRHILEIHRYVDHLREQMKESQKHHQLPHNIA